MGVWGNKSTFVADVRGLCDHGGRIPEDLPRTGRAGQARLRPLGKAAVRHHSKRSSRPAPRLLPGRSRARRHPPNIKVAQRRRWRHAEHAFSADSARFVTDGDRTQSLQTEVVARAVAHRPGESGRSPPMTNPQPWTWDWTAIAALGTVTAALLSVAAIIIAAKASAASARAATAAERQLAAVTTPVVVEVPRGGYLAQHEQLRFPDGQERSSPIEGDVVLSVPDGGDALCSLPVQNVGSGLARITRAYLDFGENAVDFLQWPHDGADDESRASFMVVSRARPSHIWLPAGGQTRLAAAVPATDEAKWRAMQTVTLQPQNFAEVRMVSRTPRSRGRLRRCSTFALRRMRSTVGGCITSGHARRSRSTHEVCASRVSAIGAALSNASRNRLRTRT